jgi:hypothetical protein
VNQTSIQYRDLANAIIKHFSDVLGSDRAIRLARNVDGLAIEPAGQVEHDISADTLDRLVREYQAVGGTVAVLMMKRTVAQLAKDGNLALPGALR